MTVIVTSEWQLKQELKLPMQLGVHIPGDHKGVLRGRKFIRKKKFFSLTVRIIQCSKLKQGHHTSTERQQRSDKQLGIRRMEDTQVFCYRLACCLTVVRDDPLSTQQHLPHLSVSLLYSHYVGEVTSACTSTPLT